MPHTQALCDLGCLGVDQGLWERNGHVHTWACAHMGTYMWATHIRCACIRARTHIQACAHLGPHTGLLKSVRNIFVFWLSGLLLLASGQAPALVSWKREHWPRSSWMPVCTPRLQGAALPLSVLHLLCWRDERSRPPASCQPLAPSASIPDTVGLACRHHTSPLCPPGWSFRQNNI